MRYAVNVAGGACGSDGRRLDVGEELLMFRLGHVITLTDGVEELQRDPGRPGQRPEHLLRQGIVDAHVPRTRTCRVPHRKTASQRGSSRKLRPLRELGLVPNVMDPSSQTSRQTTVRAVGPLFGTGRRQHKTALDDVAILQGRGQPLVE